MLSADSMCHPRFVGSQLVLLVMFVGCGGSIPKGSQEPSQVKIGAPLNKTDSQQPVVLFDLKPSGTPPNPLDMRLYDCEYRAHGRIAKFRLQLTYGRLNRPLQRIFRWLW